MCWGLVLPNWICLTKLRTAPFFKVNITIVITKLYQLPLKLQLHLSAPRSWPVQHIPHLTVSPSLPLYTQGEEHNLPTEQRQDAKLQADDSRWEAREAC